MSLPVQRLEGKYEILEKLGEGGMGAVYKVRHLLLDELRVVKVMRSALRGDEELEARFKREARVATKLRHPNIAQLYDFTLDEDGNAFIVLEFIEGLTLEELLKRFGPLPLGLTLEIARQSLKAIGYLHRKNFVHRDISPDNLMLSRDVDRRPQIKLIDLGIAKVLEGDPGLTATGMFLGKVRYTSPEQLDGTVEQLDGRSDLYSFGVVLYELLTGRSPIEGSTPPSVIAGHLFREPLAFGETDPQGRVPGGLRETVMHALAKKRDQRIADAQVFSRELGKLQREFPKDSPESRKAFDEIVAVFGQKRTASQVGSTQDRLDRQFGLRSTPTHREGTPAGDAPERETVVREQAPTERVDEPRRQRAAHDPQQIGMLLSGARKLVELGQPEAAQQQLQALRTLDSESPELLDLLQEIDRELLRRRRQAAAEEIEAVLESGDLGAARTRFELVVDELGVDDVLAELGERLQELLRLAEIDRLVAEARERSAEEDYRRAVESLEEAERLGPDHTRVRTLLAEAREAAERQEEERRRRAAVAEIETRLSANELDDAGEALSAAVAEYGESEDLLSLRQQLVEARERETERRRNAALAEIGKRLEAHELDAAAGLLSAAVAEYGESEALEPLRQRLAEEREREVERRRKAAAAEIEARLAIGELETVERLLGEAIVEHGESDDFRFLRDELEEARRQEQERNRQAAALEIAACIETGELDDAEDLLSAAVAEHGESGELEKLQGRLAEARELAEVGARVESALGEGLWDEAGSLLDGARRKFGERPILKDQAQRLEEGKRQSLEQAAQNLVDKARKKIEAEDYQGALADLQQASRLAPEHSEGARLKSETRDALKRQRDARQRAQALERAAAEIDRLLAAGELDKAEKKLAQAAGKWGEASELAASWRRLETARDREGRQKKFDALLSEARECEGAKRFDDALAKLDEAEGLDVAATGIAVLRSEVEEARRHAQAVERRREIREAAAAIEKELDAGDLDGASRKLETATGTFGVEGSLKTLRTRVERARRKVATTQALDRDAERTVQLEKVSEPPPFFGGATERVEDPVDGTVATPLADVRTVVQGEAPVADATAALAAETTRALPTSSDVTEIVPDPIVDEEEKIAPRPALKKSWVPLVAAAILAGVLVAWWVLPGADPAAPPPLPPAAATGAVVLRASPWGQVTAIRDAEGQAVEVPDESYTPFMLELPPGEYEIDLSSFEGMAPQTVRVTIGDGEPEPETIIFREVSVDDFFKSVGY